MSDLTQNTSGSGKWYAGFVAAFLATYVVDHLQTNYGIDFKQLGTDPAVFKALIEGSFVSLLVWASPSHLVQSVTDAILFCKAALKEWRDALRNNPPTEGK